MNLNDLFNWKSELHLKAANGEALTKDGEEVVLYQRVVGDADLETARKNALRASRKLRKSLKDKDSLEHNSILPEYEDMTKEELSNAIIMSSIVELRSEATSTADLPKEPKEPGESAELEEREEYQNALDEYAKSKQKAIEDRTSELIEDKKKSLMYKNKAELRKLFLESAINSLARTKMIDTFNHWCAYLGTYIDPEMQERAFSSYAEYANTYKEIKEQVVSSYLDLELSTSNLKK